MQVVFTGPTLFLRNEPYATLNFRFIGFRETLKLKKDTEKMDTRYV